MTCRCDGTAVMANNHSCNTIGPNPFSKRVHVLPAHLTARQPSVLRLPASSTRGPQLLLILLLLLMLEALLLKPRPRRVVLVMPRPANRGGICTHQNLPLPL